MDFEINDIKWKIIEKTQKEIKEIQNSRLGREEKEDTESIRTRYFGSTFCDELIIYLDRDLPKQRKRRTLMHELAHCYIDSYITHLEKQYEEEDVADIVSNSFDFINKIITNYFKESD